MKSPVLIALAALMIAAGCNRAPQNQEAVRQAVIEHLGRNSTGLDTSKMQIDVDSVSFREKEATATVSFKPKGMPDQALALTYILEDKGGKWMVKGKAQSAHGATPQSPAAMPDQPAALPPGHPAVPPGKTP